MTAGEEICGSGTMELDRLSLGNESRSRSLTRADCNCFGLASSRRRVCGSAYGLISSGSTLTVRLLEVSYQRVVKTGSPHIRRSPFPSL